MLIGTIRKNGWPRISPFEPLITDGHLYFGMMGKSQKALDLLRDPRCTVHSVISNRDASEGEFKVYGRGVEIQDLEARRHYADALYEKMGWKPEEPEYHLFSVDVENVAFAVLQNDKWIREVWNAA